MPALSHTDANSHGHTRISTVTYICTHTIHADTHLLTHALTCSTQAHRGTHTVLTCSHTLTLHTNALHVSHIHVHALNPQARAHAHPHPHTHSYLTLLHMFTLTAMHARSGRLLRSHTHTHTLALTLLLRKPTPHPRLPNSLSLQSHPGLASSAGCSLPSLPSWFYLFFLATMSIFGEGSIFILSGNIFPLSHELGRSVRRLLAAMAGAGSGGAKPGWRRDSPGTRGCPEVLWSPEPGCCLRNAFG